jgi:hypothetical protein
MNATTHYLLRLVDALRLLPGVKPASERNRLGEAKYWATRSPDGIADCHGIRVARADLDQLFIPDEQGRPCVSPAGAALLLDLYRRNAFELFEGRKSAGDLELLTRYANGEALPAAALRPGPVRKKAKSKPQTPSPASKRESPASPSYEHNSALTVHRLD